mmetsp:Transcript_9511/g.29593  ORF Transcript_9511/g.29593 Transcript_9511/m.29593 type:complete len:217 (-) Transcript_9511:902-1552(-)
MSASLSGDGGTPPSARCAPASEFRHAAARAAPSLLKEEHVATIRAAAAQAEHSAADTIRLPTRGCGRGSMRSRSHAGSEDRSFGVARPFRIAQASVSSLTVPSASRSTWFVAKSTRTVRPSNTSSATSSARSLAESSATSNNPSPNALNESHFASRCDASSAASPRINPPDARSSAEKGASHALRKSTDVSLAKAWVTAACNACRRISMRTRQGCV